MNEYNPFRTAIKRRVVSVPMRYLIEQRYVTEQDKIIDFGCGHNLDSKYLSKKGFNIVGYDKYNSDNNNSAILEDSYDILVCHYVFNVMPNIEHHHLLMKQFKSIADTSYITVRADKKAIRDNWEYNSESKGYWTTTKTFQRLYDIEMIHELYEDVDIIKSTSSYIIIKL